MKRLRLYLANVGLRTMAFPLVTPPIGLMSLAAYLRQKFDVEIMLVNQRLDNCTPETLVRRAADFGADIVGLSSLTTSAHRLPALTQAMREALPNALIALGGPYASSSGAEALEATGADVAVAGEGELAFERVVQAWLDGGDFSAVPGLLWRAKDGTITCNPGVLPFIEDLDSLPMPAYDLIDLPAYWRRQSIAPIVRRKYVSIVSSRGCPYRCLWCHNIFGKGIRMHSPERIVDEIEHLKRTYGVEDVEFLDDNFNFNPDRVIRFAELLQQRNIKVKLAFPTAVRGDIITQEVIDALCDAGMYFCGFSLESGSKRIQEYTCKRLNIPRFLQGVEMATAKRVYVQGFCMMGFPTETEEDLKETIDVACSSRFHTVSFFTVTPFPGTALYDMVKSVRPEKLARIRYNDMDFSGMRVNLTDLPDEVLYAYQRKALRQFFMNPGRIARIVRDYPQPWLLPYYLPILWQRATKGILSNWNH